MNVIVNGDEKAMPEGTTIEALLVALGAPQSGRGVAVAKDGEVVPRSQWHRTMLAAGDQLEVLSAVQGG